jgi:hypothetical protein
MQCSQLNLEPRTACLTTIACRAHSVPKAVDPMHGMHCPEPAWPRAARSPHAMLQQSPAHCTTPAASLCCVSAVLRIWQTLCINTCLRHIHFSSSGPLPPCVMSKNKHSQCGVPKSRCKIAPHISRHFAEMPLCGIRMTQLPGSRFQTTELSCCTAEYLHVAVAVHCFTVRLKAQSLVTIITPAGPVHHVPNARQLQITNITISMSGD